MQSLGQALPESAVTRLERRVARLSALLEVATQQASDRQIRDGGAQLIERLGEWLEDIKDLREVGDEDVHEMVRSFELRLKLAERKVDGWAIPPSVKRKLGAPSELTQSRRRGRPRKVQTAA